MLDHVAPTEDSSDEIGARLAAIEDQLRDELLGVAIVEHRQVADRITSVTIEPRRDTSLAVHWTILGAAEIILQAGHNGGHWELEYTARDIDFLEDITRSVVAGRAVETFAWRRSRVEVTLDRGDVAHETGGQGFLSMLPLPAWRKWGRRIQYDAYR